MNKPLINALPCPFCESTNIQYSTKCVTTSDYIQIHAACFCNDCHAYGPRVLSSHIKKYDYARRKDTLKNPEIKAGAIALWNKR